MFFHHGKKITTSEKTAPLSGPLSDYAGHSVIFLDVDGVLNCIATRDRICHMIGLDDDKIDILKQLTELLDADIILSSSWKDAWFREEKDRQDEFANALDERLAAHGLTIRDKTDDQGYDRGAGILEWIRVHGPLKRYVILDDEGFDFKKAGIARHWVRTSWSDPQGGLGVRHLQYIRKHSSLYI